MACFNNCIIIYIYGVFLPFCFAQTNVSSQYIEGKGKREKLDS